MSALSFLLAIAAISVGAGWLTSVLSLGVSLVPIALSARWSPARRADVAVWAALAPALVTLGLLVAVALPSTLAALGLAADHCAAHTHHGHLCWRHAPAIGPFVALVGATALALVAVPLGQVVVDVVGTSRHARALRALGAPQGPVTWVPAGVPICVATGLWRPTTLVSRALLTSLDAEQLEAALAHERAHCVRRDPLWSVLVAVGGCFAFPGVGRWWRRVWRHAAEEAADAEAAREHGPGVVAAALVRVARLHQRFAAGVGFGDVGLEARVRRLLEQPPAAAASVALPGVLLLVLAVVVPVVVGFDAVHHQVESSAQGLFAAGG